MWKKIFKVVFYIAFALMLLAVIGGSVVCFIYAAMEKEARFWLFGALTLIGGTIVTFVAFAFTGMVIEMMDNIEAIRKKVDAFGTNVMHVPAPVKPAEPVNAEITVTPEPAAAEEEIAAEKEEAEMKTAESWICPTCGSVNPAADQFCTTCGTKKH